MIYKFGCLLSILLLTGNTYGAEINKTLDKNIERAVLQHMQTKRSYPGLSKKQLAQIPHLLSQAKQQAHRADMGLDWVTEEDVIANLHFYLGGGYNPLEEYAVTEEEKEEAAQFSVEDLEHALHYALVSILDEKYRSFLEPQLYPAVKDWNAFYELCQAFMDEFYKVLSEDLATGNKSVIEEVFLNDPD